MAAGITLTSTVFVLVASSIVYFFVRLYQVRSFYKDLPKPPHSFLWGHLKLMGEINALFPPSMHPQAYYTAIARKYNLQGMFYLDLWPIGPQQVVLTDPELQDQVSIKKPLHQHPLSAEFLGPMVGDQNVAVVNGPLWKSLHNALAPAFSWSHIRSVTGITVDQCVEFRKILDRLAENKEVFSMESTAVKLVFDIIGLLVFNFPLHAQTQGSQHLDDLQEMIVLAEADLDITKKLNLWLQIKTFFRRRIVLGRLHPSITAKVLDRYDLLLREKVVPSRKSPYSLLDLMLRDKVQDADGNIRARDSKALTAHEMRILIDNIKGLLVGGQGTTNDTLCYIYILLSKSPEVLEKMRLEHDSVLSKDHYETISMMIDTPEKVSQLSFTDAIIREILRLFPIGFGVKIAAPGDRLAYKGQSYPIDNSLAVVCNGHDTHYNPKYFPEPAKFQPERWLDRENEIPRSYFRTFGRGPRACQGQNMAINTLKIILVMTIRDYDFSCADMKPNDKPRIGYTDLDTIFGDVVFQELGMEAKPRGGVPMTVTKRIRT